jgi:hypothetical protein
MGWGVDGVNVDLKKEPYNKLSGEKSYKPTNKEFTAEICHQAIASGVAVSKIPRPGNRPNKNSITWLKKPSYYINSRH